MFTFARLIMFLLCGLLPGMACAAEVADLASVYRAATEQDARLAGSRANVAARRTLVPQALAGLLPSISVDASGSKTWSDTKYKSGQIGAVTGQMPGTGITPSGPITLSQNYNRSNWQATARQPIINFGAWFGLNGARALAKQASHDLESAKQDLIVRTVQSYMSILRARDLFDSIQAEEAAFKRQLEQAQQRFDLGLVAVTDVLEVRAAYDNVVVRRIQAAADQFIFFEALNTTTNQNFKAIGRLSADLPIEKPEGGDMEHWVQQALQKNWMIKSLEFALKASRQEVKKRRAQQHLPTVEATAQYSRNELGGIAASFQGDQTTTRSVQLRASLPIFQGGGLSAQTKQAKFQQEEARHKLLEQHRAVDRDIRSLYQSVSTNVYRVKARLKAIESARSALKAVRAGYEAGTRTIIDVLQAERNAHQSQFDYASARYDYVMTMFRLKQTAGILSGQDVVDFNRFIEVGQAVEFLPPSWSTPE